ncbi:MAG: DNA ligase D [Chitinophagaceae bacterium]|nr:MAG: DNA ligase D [Chitinophagaceae bacterium]
MALATYRKKRSFSHTPEPSGGKPTGQQLRFVVQKHDASRLHYDFRLEMDGVLKSWAVPKGPSTDPSVKRLAMMVEDHPYDYRNFEGIIPKGQYGGGTVIVWDEGVYEPAEGKFSDKRSQEKNLLSQLRKGKILFILKGKKLKGEYALVKSSYQGENSWLLMKVKDKYARITDITKKARSVISGKTIAEMEKKPDKVYSQKDVSPRATASPKKKTARKKASVKRKKPTAGKRSPFPSYTTPMLATLVDKPFDEPGWTYEIKWDGYRALAFMNGKKTSLISRNNKSFSERFYPVFEAIKQWGLHAVVDGEIVVINDKGVADFGSLQNWRSEADGSLFYYVFDILWLNGYDLTGLPLQERREILKSNLPKEEGIIRMSESFDTSAEDLLKAAGKMGIEGIMAKKAESLYTPGIRTREWLKIKTNLRHEVVIGGYTRNEGTSKAFSSLLVGVFENGKLQYTGKIGTGFNQEQQQKMIRLFKPLVTKKSPFNTEPDVNKPSRFRPDPPHAKAIWLKPKLVCEVSYREVTSDGVMRHPSFEGMRDDKKATDVIRETPIDANDAKRKSKSANDAKGKSERKGRKAPATNNANSATKRVNKNKLMAKTGSGERKTLLNPKDKSQVREVSGHELQFTNLSKIYWPKEKITKRDLINYYYQAAPYILPYLKGRPQSLNRFPNGINGQSFYQKDVTGKIPDWIDTFPYRSQDEDKDKNFMVCNDEATLLYMANLGCIEINPWSSTVKKPDNPDWCIIDLDPGKRTEFEQVIEAAQVTGELLEKAGIPCYAKTSGSTGIHIYIPLGAAYSYDQSKEFARLIVTLVHQQIPEFTSLERSVSGRKGKMYLDFLQNRPQATLAAPYSVRPKPGATVSMPLRWDEVKKGLKMQDFTIQNTIGLLKKRGNLFKPVLGKGINMVKAIEKLEKI